ncbi:MAG: glutamate formimidoyltransferase [Ardenticatenia bacterium]|nr:glutamate formimidoyltransferase [Ardenticatenia bacterium]
MGTVPLVECVPNFSEGRRPDVVAQIVEAITAVSGVHLLDVHTDASHNRSVVTCIGPPDAVAEAAFRGAARAAQLIDLRAHKGVHPRIGATDVIPFIPVRGVRMADCVALARQVGRRIGEELSIPVYLYGEAATCPDRRYLSAIRRGGFEALKAEIATRPERTPDFGPTKVGPAGATAVGARFFLIAFNVYLNTDDVEKARHIARAVRASSGGLQHVQAMGVLVDGQAQVSMNITDYRRTPLHRALELVRREAARYGLTVTHTELVGVAPLEAWVQAAAWYLQVAGFRLTQVLETHLLDD